MFMEIKYNGLNLDVSANRIKYQPGEIEVALDRFQPSPKTFVFVQDSRPRFYSKLLPRIKLILELTFHAVALFYVLSTSKYD